VGRGLISKSFVVIFSCIVVQGAFAAGSQTTPANQLHQAVIAGDTSKIEQLLSDGVDVDSRNGLSWTALHTAIRNNQKAVIELLLSNNADVNAKDRNGQTPLHFAVESGQKDVIASLIAKKANVNAADNNGETALMLANMADQTAIADTLVKAGATQTAQQTSSQSPFGAPPGGPAVRGEAGGRSNRGGRSGQQGGFEQMARGEGSFDPAEQGVRGEAGGRGGRGGRSGQQGGTEQMARGEGSFDQMSRGESGGRGNRGANASLEQRITDPAQTPQAENISDTAIEPNEISNRVVSFENILADPCEIAARIKKYDGLQKAVEDAAGKSRIGMRQWRLTDTDNRSVIVRAFQTQLEVEYDFLIATANEEKAAATAKAIETLKTEKAKWATDVRAALTTQARSARTTTRTSTSARSTSRGTRGTTQSYNMGTTTQEIQPVQEEISQTGTPVDVWLNTDILTLDGRITLAETITDEIQTEYGSIRDTALGEKAEKTVAAVDGIVLAMQKRFQEAYTYLEQLQAKQGTTTTQTQRTTSTRGRTTTTGRTGTQTQTYGAEQQGTMNQYQTTQGQRQGRGR
jgi:hypothetical protein